MTGRYGPQTPEVHTFLSRIRRLTLAEAETIAEISEIWSAASDEAVSAARCAWGDSYTYWKVRQAAADACRESIPAASFFLVEPIRDGASALASRHLIDEEGPFTQAHYDTMTVPVASVIGPLHPGDRQVSP